MSPLLFQNPPNPDECQMPEGSCPTCRFLQRCKDILKNESKNVVIPTAYDMHLQDCIHAQLSCSNTAD
jgi:hypothetical protein